MAPGAKIGTASWSEIKPTKEPAHYHHTTCEAEKTPDHIQEPRDPKCPTARVQATCNKSPRGISSDARRAPPARDGVPTPDRRQCERKHSQGSDASGFHPHGDTYREGKDGATEPMRDSHPSKCRCSAGAHPQSSKQYRHDRE